MVIGSARSLSSELSGLGLGLNDLFAASALAWLTGRARTVEIGDKTPESLRLIMTAGQLRRSFVLVVVVIPLLFFAPGLVVLWRRRRG